MTIGSHAGGCAGCNYPFLTHYERDYESDLDYAQARYFSNHQGRFTSPEPYVIVFALRGARNERERFQLLNAYISEPRNWNRYTYCVNDPMNLIDPSGLIWLTKDNQNYHWVDDDKYRAQDWQGYKQVEPGTYAYFGEGWGGYDQKYKGLMGSYVVLNADGSLSPAGVRETEAPSDSNDRAIAGFETMRQWNSFRTTLPDFAPAYVQVELDVPTPFAVGPAIALTLDRNGSFYTGGGAFVGSPGVNGSAGWLYPNEPARNIEAFLTGDSFGGSAISPYWVGGGVTRSSGRTSPQVMLGQPGISGSWIRSAKRANFGRLW